MGGREYRRNAHAGRGGEGEEHGSGVGEYVDEEGEVTACTGWGGGVERRVPIFHVVALEREGYRWRYQGNHIVSGVQ